MEFILTIVSGKPWSELQADQWVNHEFPFPFVMIDTKVLWLGLPLEGVAGNTATIHCSKTTL